MKANLDSSVNDLNIGEKPMVLLVECLLYKHKNLCLDSQHPCKSWTRWHTCVTLALGEGVGRMEVDRVARTYPTCIANG